MSKYRVLAFVVAVGVVTACSRKPDPVIPAQPQVDAKALEIRLAAMTARMDTLVAHLEELQARNDSLRRSSTRMESEIRDRDEQIKAIRLELQRLKEIDLKPRPKPD